MSDEQTPLPAPRLQLRWALATPEERRFNNFGWACHYELVLPLDKHDVRREVYDENGDPAGEVSELVVPIKSPSLRGGGGTPCEAQDGSRYYDAPYRDGAHARWDAAVLGNPPIYVIAPDGTPFKRPEGNTSK